MNEIIFTTAYQELQPVQRLFVDGYVRDLERIAARRGGTLRSALEKPFPFDLDVRARQALQISVVRIAIVDRVRELEENAVLSVGRTLKEITSIAYSNIGDYTALDQNGVPCPNLSKCTPEQKAAIKTIKVDQKPTGLKIEIVQHDKLRALELLMKHLGLLTGEPPKANKPNSSAAVKSTDTLEEIEKIYALSLSGEG